VQVARADPNFDAQRAEGMLKSDPALLYYFTERILAAGGGMPADFHADPRVQHPGLTDIPAEFTVGQEFLVAWAYRAFGGDAPLHLFCTWLMALVASLAVVGVWLVTIARTKSVLWASLAAGLFVLLPANYRTIGFILVREDLSFPLFALHLGFLALAERRRTWPLFLASGLALAGALATWHALGFFLLVELLVLVVGYLVTGRNPLRLPGAWAVAVGPALAGLFVPALRESGFLLGPAMLVIYGWGAAAGIPRLRGAGRPAVLWLWAGMFAVAAFALPGASAYAHVYEVLWAKVAHLGVKPVDPNALSFDARLLWQGPFETLAPGVLRAYLGWGAAALLTALVVAARRRAELLSCEGFLLGLTLLSLPLAWLIGRTFILSGLCVPAAAAVWLAVEERRRIALGVLVGVLALQALSFASFVRDHTQSWYLPRGRQAEIAGLVEWVGANIPAEEAIASDFMNSTALLAHTGNPIVLQPKYETDRSRRQAQLFLETFFAGTPDEFGRLVREHFECRYVLIDRYTLGYLSPYTAGHVGAPTPGTAAAVFLSQEDVVLRGVPGFELLYRSPDSIRQINGAPYDFFRLYRVE